MKSIIRYSLFCFPHYSFFLFHYCLYLFHCFLFFLHYSEFSRPLLPIIYLFHCSSFSLPLVPYFSSTTPLDLFHRLFFLFGYSLVLFYDFPSSIALLSFCSPAVFFFSCATPFFLPLLPLFSSIAPLHLFSNSLVGNAVTEFIHFYFILVPKKLIFLMSVCSSLFCFRFWSLCGCTFLI